VDFSALSTLSTHEAHDMPEIGMTSRSRGTA
jgi:hypothetical protein